MNIETSDLNKLADWLEANGDRPLTLREIANLPFMAPDESAAIEALFEELGYSAYNCAAGIYTDPVVYVPCGVCPNKAQYAKREGRCCKLDHTQYVAATAGDLRAFARMFGRAEAPDRPGLWIWLFVPDGRNPRHVPFARLRFARLQEGQVFFLWPEADRPGWTPAKTVRPADFLTRTGKWICAPLPLAALALPPGLTADYVPDEADGAHD